MKINLANQDQVITAELSRQPMPDSEVDKVGCCKGLRIILQKKIMVVFVLLNSAKIAHLKIWSV